MAIHSSVLAWRIPWTKKAGGLQFVGLQRVGHDSHTHTHTRTHNFLISITTSNLFLVLLWKVDLSPLGELFHPPAYLVPSLC